MDEVQYLELIATLRAELRHEKTKRRTDREVRKAMEEANRIAQTLLDIGAMIAQRCDHRTVRAYFDIMAARR